MENIFYICKHLEEGCENTDLTGIDVNQDNKRGWTPLLIVAANFDDSKDKYKMTKLLLDNKADINTTEPVHKMTPLMLFAKRHNYNMVNFLISQGANVKQKDILGNTFLNYIRDKIQAKELLRLDYPYKKTDFLLSLENELLVEKIDILKQFLQLAK